MDREYKTANIVYKGLEDKGPTVKVVDENGKKWVIWKKQYGTENQSEVYGTLLQYRLGEDFGVNYIEKEKSYQGKTYMERTIIDITHLQSDEMLAKTEARSPQSRPAVSFNKSDEPDWDNIAVGKCQTVFIAAFIQAGHSFEEALKSFAISRQLAEQVVYPKTVIKPTVANDEIDVSKIPF